LEVENTDLDKKEQSINLKLLESDLIELTVPVSIQNTTQQKTDNSLKKEGEGLE